MIRANYLDVSKITTDSKVLKIFEIVKNYGGVIRFVGGAVRDALAGFCGVNLNLSTDLSPDELAEACEEAGIRTVPIGLKIDTLGIKIENNIIEVASLKLANRQKDGKTAIEFTDNWEADASRRDLTINAVYADEEGNVFDYYNGIEDLEKGIVRFIGDPEQKIREDYERILRFFRFYSVFGKGKIDAKGLKACRENAIGLKEAPVEAIRDELQKILLTDKAAKVIKIIFDNNIVSSLLADSSYLANLEFLIQLEKEAGVAPDALRRLFVLYMPDKELAENMAMRLHFSKKGKERLVDWAEVPTAAVDFNPDNLIKLVYCHGKDFCLNKYLIALAAQKQRPDNFLSIISAIESAAIPQMPINGKDILRHGIADNSKIGYWMDLLEKQWISSNFALSREELLTRIS